MPIGLLVAAGFSDVAGLVTGDRFWWHASRWLLASGLASGVAAGAAGLTDFSTIERARTPVGWANMIGNLGVLGVTAANLAMRREHDRPPVAAVALSLLATMGLTLTGWLGGELAFRRGIGVVPAERV